MDSAVEKQGDRSLESRNRPVQELTKHRDIE